MISYRKTPTSFAELEKAKEITYNGSPVNTFVDCQGYGILIRYDLTHGAFVHLTDLSIVINGIKVDFNPSVDYNRLIHVIIKNKFSGRVIEWYVLNSIEDRVVVVYEYYDGTLNSGLYSFNELQMIISE